MIVKSFTNLSCAEAEKICTKDAYKEANFVDRIKLKLHLLLCKTCKKYHEDNKKLTKLIKKAKITFCSSEEKENFRQRLREGKSDISGQQK